MPGLKPSHEHSLWNSVTQISMVVGEIKSDLRWATSRIEKMEGEILTMKTSKPNTPTPASGSTPEILTAPAVIKTLHSLESWASLAIMIIRGVIFVAPLAVMAWKWALPYLLRWLGVGV